MPKVKRVDIIRNYYYNIFFKIILSGEENYFPKDA